MSAIFDGYASHMLILSHNDAQRLRRYQYSPALERNPFPAGTGTGVNSHEGNIADFIWMLTVVGIALQGIGYLMGIRFLAAGLLSAVIYLWSKRNPKAQTSFWGARFDGMWLPWILIGFKLITGDDFTIDLMGIAAGHCYYFVKDVLPGMETPLKGKNVLATPSPIYRWLGVEPTYLPPALQRMAAATARGYGAGPNAQPGPMPRAWGGAGRVLGRD